MSLNTPAARRDQSFHLQPATNLRALQKEGPLVITRGEGVYVYDEGRRYLEGMAGVAAYLVRRAQHHGAILRNMPGANVAFCPPLIITEAEIDEIIGCFSKALDDTWAMVKEKGLV